MGDFNHGGMCSDDVFYYASGVLAFGILIVGKDDLIDIEFFFEDPSELFDADELLWILFKNGNGSSEHEVVAFVQAAFFYALKIYIPADDHEKRWVAFVASADRAEAVHKIFLAYESEA